MARRSVRRRIQRKARKQAIRYMQQFALLLLADAEDWAEECTGLLLLALANKHWRDLNHSARYGRRGPYNAPKNETFLNYILFETSDRFFRAFMRYVVKFVLSPTLVCVRLVADALGHQDGP